MKHRYFLSVALLLCAMEVAGCSSAIREKTVEDKYVIGVVTKSRKGEYWMSVYSGMEKSAKDNGVEVIILAPDTETDKVIQKRMIDDLIKMQVDALAVSPIDSFDNQDYLATAKEREIPVYSYDTAIEDAKVPYIGIDNEKAGYDLGEVLAEKLDYRGQIAAIDIQKDSIQAVLEGKIAALAAQSGYDIGYETICYILRDRQGEDQEFEKKIEVEILTPENVAEYNVKHDSRT